MSGASSLSVSNIPIRLIGSSAQKPELKIIFKTRYLGVVGISLVRHHTHRGRRNPRLNGG